MAQLPNTELRALVSKLAARPQGVAAREIEPYGYNRSQISNATSRMTRAGALISVRHGNQARAFTRAEDAERFRQAVQRPAPGSRSLAGPRSRAPWPKDAPPYFPKHANGKPAYKITICPSCKVGLRTNTHSQ